VFTIHEDGGGVCFVDVSGVRDPEAERLLITVQDGRAYPFRLVDNAFMVLDHERCDGKELEGFERALAVCIKLRSQPSERVAFFRVWNPARRHLTHQPKIGEWLALLIGPLGIPSRPSHIEGVRHSMLGGPIVSIDSKVLQP
jgi:hypothetical protein